jgi:uncharacterized RDD family membrane protein YckC
VVNPSYLAFDILSVATTTAIPGIAWAALFALAWRHPGFAESAGLGRTAFWLLLPGAILSSFALLPVVAVSADILAVSFAGAVFPLGVGAVALGRLAPASSGWGFRLFGALAGETGLLLGVVLLGDAGAFRGLAHAWGTSPLDLTLVLVVVVATGITVVVWGLSGREGPTTDRGVSGTFVLTSAVLVLTFLGARAIPSVGITESFPYFLLPPVLAGVFVSLFASQLFPGSEGFALPVAFFAGGWGVALGADVLWEPPLYGTGPGGLYAVGGAGVLDLVYLSCFLGLLGAWLTHRILGRGYAPVGTPLPPPPPSPGRHLREAYALAADDASDASVRASAEAARASALQAHRLLGRPPPDPARPWVGLPVPGWVVSDQANLESSAHAAAVEPREAMRAFVTARALVRLGDAIGRPRFASISQRLLAFGIDVALLGAGAAAVFVGIVLLTPGGLNGVLASVPFNAAIYGFVAVGLLYFALAELGSGTTLGKTLVGIEVRDRSMGPVGGLASFARNAPLLPVLTLFSLGLALSIAIALRGIAASATVPTVGPSAGALAIVGLAVVVLTGVGLAGGIGIAAIAVTPERQRVGDLWAGTWVVRRLSGPPARPGASADRSA